MSRDDPPSSPPALPPVPPPPAAGAGPAGRARFLGRSLGPGELCVIAGPCILEGRPMAREVAGALKEITARLGLPLIFKASYRKENRSSVHSFTGMGDAAGLDLLREIRDAFALPVLTDVHGPEEVLPAAEVCACLQVPAFLCRQTRLVQAAAAVAGERTGAARAVNIKKGQFMAPDDMARVVEKARAVAPQAEIWLTERGATFGYHNLVVDMRVFPVLRRLPVTVIFDVTHSLQHPGSGGDRAYAMTLARAALAAGADGLFFETHPDPARALSDPTTQLPLSGVAAFLEEMVEWKRLQARWIDRADPVSQVEADRVVAGKRGARDAGRGEEEAG